MAKRTEASASTTHEPSLFPDHPQGERRRMFSLPARFRATTEPTQGMVTLRDSETQREARIPAGCYGEVRRVLGAFFGGEDEGETDYVPDAGRPAVPVRATDDERAPPQASAPIADDASSPKKPLFGAALKSFERRHAAAEDVRPVAKSGTDASNAPEAREAATGPGKDAARPSTAKAAKGAAASSKPSAAAPGRKTNDAPPEGWQAKVEGVGYVMEFMVDPDTGASGYRVLAGDMQVAQVREEFPGKLVLQSADGSFEASLHRNVLGVMSRLDVVFGD